MPTGSNPASRTNTNSLTDRSLVNKRRLRMSARRSRACTGRSSLLTRRLVHLERGLFGLFGGDLDIVFVVLGFDQGIVPAPERDHRQHERGQLVRGLLALGDPANAGAEPRQIDIDVVERAPAEPAGHLAHVDGEIAADNEL